MSFQGVTAQRELVPGDTLGGLAERLAEPSGSEETPQVGHFCLRVRRARSALGQKGPWGSVSEEEDSVSIRQERSDCVLQGHNSN